MDKEISTQMYDSIQFLLQQEIYSVIGLFGLKVVGELLCPCIYCRDFREVENRSFNHTCTTTKKINICEIC